VANKCKGLQLNDECNKSEQCDPGLRCAGKVCVKLLAVGASGCSEDFDCLDSACVNGACVAYFS
jgi:hypothetical protein